MSRPSKAEKTGENRAVRGENWVWNRQVKWPRKSAIMRHGRDRWALKGIAFTGYGTAQDMWASEEAGFAHHLAKPSDLGLLVNLIRRTAS